MGTFKCLGLAYAAGQIGETAPAWMNGANEAAVGAFLAGTLIGRRFRVLIERALEEYDGNAADSIESVIERTAEVVNALQDMLLKEFLGA